VSAKSDHVVSIGLSAAIVSVAEERPSVLVVHHAGAEDALPFGPFDPLNHRTLDSGLRKWVGEQTYLDLGYAEQLYTFGDRGRHLPTPNEGARVVSVGYLALTRQARELKAPDTRWSDWYRYFPWEDRRDAKRCGNSCAAHRIAARLNCAATACGFASARTVSPGTKRRCSSVTSCSTKRASCKRRRAMEERRRPRRRSAWA
jgi:hypothetical protein